jgi:hypothetical protein
MALQPGKTPTMSAIGKPKETNRRNPKVQQLVKPAHKGSHNTNFGVILYICV